MRAGLSQLHLAAMRVARSRVAAHLEVGAASARRRLARFPCCGIALADADEEPSVMAGDGSGVWGTAPNVRFGVT